MEIRHYTTKEGVDPLQDWLDEPRTSKRGSPCCAGSTGWAAIPLGDRKFCRDGVWELRIDLGPGYRIYYARVGKAIVVLLCGGSKRSQASDIRTAVRYWQDYRHRHSPQRPA